MNITETIKHLEEIRERHGDISVCTTFDDNYYLLYSDQIEVILSGESYIVRPYSYPYHADPNTESKSFVTLG